MAVGAAKEAEEAAGVEALEMVVAGMAAVVV